MDAAQAEKMREREAMENVKLLYHDNMIEMTPVSIARMVVLTPHQLVLLIALTFVTAYSEHLYHINIFKRIVGRLIIIKGSIQAWDYMKYYLSL